MSILFTPFKLGQLQIRNRFVLSACEDNLATDKGMITEKIIEKYKKLAKGEIGLIISSHMSVHPLGRTSKFLWGIHNNEMIPGLRKLVETVHQNDGKIIFQLGHAGLQTTSNVIGQTPLSPSGDNKMTENSIYEVIQAFCSSAQRALESGADGIQLHAAHGYLINEFLSPYYNHREDSWGGSENNRFRLLKEIIISIKKILSDGKLLLVKLNSNDFTPSEGIIPTLAVSYAKSLTDLKIDGLEVSCGTTYLSPWNIFRGEVPVEEFIKAFSEPQKSQVKAVLKKAEGKFNFEKPYNLEATKMIKSVSGNMPVFAVGGWRHLTTMEDAVNRGDTDFISMCRPFIREPSLVKKFKKGETNTASCNNCNKCLAALANHMPVNCYYNGFPD